LIVYGRPHHDLWRQHNDQLRFSVDVFFVLEQISQQWNFPEERDFIMLRNVSSVILLIIYLIAPVIAAGQDVPTGKWWYNPQIQKNLNLSKKEVGKLDKLFANSRRRLIKLKSKVLACTVI